MKAATRSRPECAASERIPKLRVVSPTTSLRTVTAAAASNEFSATVRFSKRMLFSSGLSSEVDTASFSQVLWRPCHRNWYARMRQLSLTARSAMAIKPTVLVTGVSGNLGASLLRQLADFQVIGVDVREPTARADIFRFEKVDLAEERSCSQMLELMRAYRPEAVAHLAFVIDPLRAGVLDRRAMWQTNVVGTSRVLEAIAEHNRMVGGVEKFVFPSGAAVYGPEPKGLVKEDAALNAQSLAYALHQQEA